MFKLNKFSKLAKIKDWGGFRYGEKLFVSDQSRLC